MTSIMSNEIRWLIKEKYGGVRSEEAEKDIERIKQGEPVGYVIGFVEFLGCKIDLSQRPLIPRPETEFWVEQAIADVKSSAFDKIKCLDIFAGSGCTGVAILKNIPSSTVDFVDSDSKAIKQIKINCELNGISTSRWQVINSDIFESVTGSYNYILANPPYIARGDKEIEESVLKYESHKALFAGPDGLDIIKKFFIEAKKYLNNNGKIYMEFSSVQKEKIEKILEKSGFREIAFLQDQFGKWRCLVLSK